MGVNGMRRIAVIGTGYVGIVSGSCLANIGNEVTCCDIDADKISRLQQGSFPLVEPGLEELITFNKAAGRLTFTSDIPSAIQEADILIIAVGTPVSASGEVDLSAVQAAAAVIGQNLNRYKIVVNKSTVPVGTAKVVQTIIENNRLDCTVLFDVVSNPEFLREGNAVYDCMHMERVIIGACNDHAAQTIGQLYENYETTLFYTTPESAEMIKYASNAFLATKISFINSIANICERVGADVTDVAAGIGLDNRIGKLFLQAGIGYGGSCFPKDARALIRISKEAGYDFKLLQAVTETNAQQRMVVVEKLKNVLGSLKDRKIAVLGLVFKPNTDDMREAPSLCIIEALLQSGAVIQAFDPAGMNNAARVLPAEVRYFEGLYDTVSGADACVILTEWKEIVQMDLVRVKKGLKLPIMIDGRNCFSPSIMESLGFIYHSIGRPSSSMENGYYYRLTDK